MNTLLMRMVAPMQSWGTESRFSVRDSGLEPSKSGVIGLVCAALGRGRKAPLDDLNSLRMGVRVDREGTLRCDYQIAQDVMLADGRGLKQSITSNRYYLSDAAFLVGLEGSDFELLGTIQYALQHPAWLIFLGRKAFVPAAPVRLQNGLHAGEQLEIALQQEGWIYPWPEIQSPREVRVVIDDPTGSQARADVPISFFDRTFTSRRIKTYYMSAPTKHVREVEDVSFKIAA
jgi:CRISPR system Cascade subunit CasD